jgi:hypothetical protein
MASASWFKPNEASKEAATQIKVVLNWFEELKRRVPTGKQRGNSLNPGHADLRSARMANKTKYFKTALAKVSIQLPHRRTMTITVSIPPTLEKRLYQRLRKRFERP